MKKIVNLFLWFCTATLLAQACVLGLAAMKGNVNRQTLTQIIALLNGIDIQSMRFKEALVSSRSVPVPTYQDVLEAKTDALLQQDSRGRALDSYQRRLEESQRKLEEEKKRFDQRREEFQIAVESKRAGVEAEKLGEVQKLIEALSPELAKQQMLIMLGNNEGKKDVVAILRKMAADKQKKILAEFTSPEDEKKLAEILSEIRNGEPLNPLTEDATNPKP